MQKTSLDALAREMINEARTATAHRASRTVVGGHERVMRQTVIALIAGSQLDEHENPGEATLFVLDGRITLHANGNSWEGRRGDLIEIPPARHSMTAEEDAAVLLTAVPRGGG